MTPPSHWNPPPMFGLRAMTRMEKFAARLAAYYGIPFTVRESRVTLQISPRRETRSEMLHAMLALCKAHGINTLQLSPPTPAGDSP